MTPQFLEFFTPIYNTISEEVLLSPEAQTLQLSTLISIKDRVLRAADLWLPQDLTADQMIVEELFDCDPRGKGIIDLALVWGDVCRIVDWKTTKNLKYPSYKTYTISNDFQTTSYLVDGGDYLKSKYGVLPTSIEYRVLDEENEVRSFEMKWTAHMRADIEAQMRTVAWQYRGLTALPADVPWPRNRPHECYRGAHSSAPTCPFWTDCVNMTMPPVPEGVDLVALTPRSKSSMKDFLACPERFRRTKLCGNKIPETEEQLIGTLFHLMVSGLWKGAYERRGELGVR